jgi:dephospho-CoA kinase
MKRRVSNKAVILGLTGSFGSGKSTVAGIFRSFGAKIVDADEIAHRLISPRGPAYKKILKAFGKGILNKDKSIDRGKLAGIVFNNKAMLVKLNKIMHPAIIKIMKEEMRASRAKVIVLDAPLLIEAGLAKSVDKIILVTVKKDTQIKRLQRKTGLGRAAILKRIKCQIPLKEKERLADFIIDNNGTLKSTKKQVTKLIPGFMANTPR